MIRHRMAAVLRASYLRGRTALARCIAAGGRRTP